MKGLLGVHSAHSVITERMTITAGEAALSGRRRKISHAAVSKDKTKIHVYASLADRSSRQLLKRLTRLDVFLID